MTGQWRSIAGAIVAAAAALMPGVPAASTITYYHNDLAGSPLAATNASGQVVWRESYRPYGERLTKSAASKGNDVWFTSRRQDPETGLVYMGARYYDPVAGRFTSLDPKGFDEANPLWFGRYTYANDNPYRYVDPNGRESMAIRTQERAQVAYLRGEISRQQLNDLYRAQEAGANIGLLVEGAVAGMARLLARVGSEEAASLTIGAGPSAGGGATLDNLSAQDIARIQNAANRTNTEISVVGSRASGTAGPMSDWDYVVPEATNGRTVHSLRSSLPEGARGIGEPRNQDFFKGAVDSSKPFITFKPQ